MLSFIPVRSDMDCGICLETLANQNAVAHEGDAGANHPWHPDCIKEWLDISKNCPSRCPTPLDKNSLLSRVERIKIGVNYCLDAKSSTSNKRIAFNVFVAGTITAIALSAGIPLLHPMLEQYLTLREKFAIYSITTVVVGVVVEGCKQLTDLIAQRPRD